jgi:glycosyltransferase-like protein
VRPKVGLVTYSTKPRGGVVHTLALAEELHRQGVAVEVLALGDPATGFYRTVDAPHQLIPAPPPLETLEERVAAAIDALTDGLRTRRAAGTLPPILHVQDCISARAAVRLRDEGAPVVVVRTVHHVDDFTTPDLIECQLRSILDPDRLLVVSRMWRERLADEYGVDATVVTNGVDRARFAVVPTAEEVATRRALVGADGRFLVLTVGGIEPRKGSDHLVRAMALLRERLQPSPVLAVIGGHSFQDHRAYRDAVLASLPGLGLELGRDVILLGTVPDDEIPAWYHAADAFAFPSINEGFGLVVLEALAAGTPAVVADLPVFREYLENGRDALMVEPGDDEDLAEQLHRLATDHDLRASLIGAGHEVAGRFTWSACARQHRAVYDELEQAASS